MSFDALANRLDLSGTLECVTELSLGAGPAVAGLEPGPRPFHRDALGRPLVPASSLRGALRSAIESLLRGVRAGRLPSQPSPSGGGQGWGEFGLVCGGDLPACAVGGERPLCPVCELFGLRSRASRVGFADAPVLEPWDPTLARVRRTAAVDRESETLRKSGHRAFEVLPPGTRFGLEVRLENGLDEPLDHFGLIVMGFDLLERGLASLGSGRSAGLGRVQAQWARLEYRTAASFVGLEEARLFESKNLDDCLKAARERLRAQLAARPGQEG